MRVAFRACGPAAGLGGPGARRATFDPRNFPAFIEQSAQPAGVAATADVLRDGRGEGEYYKLDTLHQRRSPIVGGLTVRAATRGGKKCHRECMAEAFSAARAALTACVVQCGQGTWSLWNTSAAADVRRCVSDITASKSRLCRLASHTHVHLLFSASTLDKRHCYFATVFLRMMEYFLFS